MRSGNNKTGYVRDICRQVRANTVRNRGKFLEWKFTDVGRRANPYQFRPVFFRETSNLINIKISVWLDAVLHGFVEHAGRARFPAMREVSSCGKEMPHYGVARAACCEIHGKIRGRTGIWLHVDIRHAKKFLRPISRDVFNFIYDLIAAVITRIGIPFRILVSTLTPLLQEPHATQYFPTE